MHLNKQIQINLIRYAFTSQEILNQHRRLTDVQHRFLTIGIDRLPIAALICQLHN